MTMSANLKHSHLSPTNREEKGATQCAAGHHIVAALKQLRTITTGRSIPLQRTHGEQLATSEQGGTTNHFQQLWTITTFLVLFAKI